MLSQNQWVYKKLWQKVAYDTLHKDSMKKHKKPEIEIKEKNIERYKKIMCRNKHFLPMQYKKTTSDCSD